MDSIGKKIHFIAIGGAVMHNLAIALHGQGFHITGSDDEIYEPSKTRLQSRGLLPAVEGWFPDKIHTGLDAVILGMHARPDNPELKRAQELNIPIYSYPEYIYQQSKDKQRIVIAGSHGKTTITSMILHVLKYYNRKFDYLVGAAIEGFDTMVKLSDDAPVIIIEGDEYFSSPIDRKPKILNYRHHIGLISGIAWDHINVFPTFEDYVRQFELFADATPKGGTLIFDENDDLVTVICRKEREDVMPVEYGTHPNKIVEGNTFLITEFGDIPVQVFGNHNMRNLNGARLICGRIGINDTMFYKAIQSFKGAAKRLEVVAKGKNSIVFRDFAHAPSKLSATTKAVRDQFKERQLIACMELHTFSSLNKEFLKQYKDTFSSPDVAIVYYNPQTIAHKRMEPISEAEVKAAFNNKKLMVFTDSDQLRDYLLNQEWQNKNLLLMSSGTFNGMDMQQLGKQIISQ